MVEQFVGSSKTVSPRSCLLRAGELTIMVVKGRERSLKCLVDQETRVIALQMQQCQTGVLPFLRPESDASVSTRGLKEAKRAGNAAAPEATISKRRWQKENREEIEIKKAETYPVVLEITLFDYCLCSTREVYGSSC